jgi:hypothetical protein
MPFRPDMGSLMVAGMLFRVIGVRILLTGLKFWTLGRQRVVAEREKILENT